MFAKRLPSLLKWAGGKELELKYILPLLPAFQRYYEPFVGGGAVFFSITAPLKLINDRSSELTRFYTLVARQDPALLCTLGQLLDGWQGISELADTHATELVTMYTTFAHGVCEHGELEQRLTHFLLAQQDVFRAMFVSVYARNCENFLLELRRNLLHKMQRMRRLERQKHPLPAKDVLPNLECALKSAFYMHLRHLYNNLDGYEIEPGVAAAIFFFVRENAYASMFRYNRSGAFNVPYGGITYNRKDLARKVNALRAPDLQAHFQNTVIENLDFEDFLLKYPPRSSDFLFLDPPYDSNFSTYTRNEFSPRDQARLADYLLARCPAKFLLVIKNTPFIRELYRHKGLDIQMFEKKYLVSFQDRNKRETEHLLIKNY